MCGAAGLAMGAVGTGVSMIGQYTAGEAANEEAKYKAAVARNNAFIAGENASMRINDARDVQTQAANDAGLVQDKTRQMISAQRTGMAGNNVDVSTGTAMDITAQTAEMGARDAQTVRKNGYEDARGLLMDAYNYQTKQRDLNNDADNALISGKNAKKAAIWSMIGTGLSGAGSAASAATYRTLATSGVPFKDASPWGSSKLPWQ